MLRFDCHDAESRKPAFHSSVALSVAGEDGYFDLTGCTPRGTESRRTITTFTY